MSSSQTCGTIEHGVAYLGPRLISGTGRRPPMCLVSTLAPSIPRKESEGWAVNSQTANADVSAALLHDRMSVSVFVLPGKKYEVRSEW